MKLKRSELAVLIFTVTYVAVFGGLNELIEFAAVLAFPNTSVGGYFNTALDLAFNTLGALTAAVLASFLASSRQQHPR